jgi:hypothetical protein
MEAEREENSLHSLDDDDKENGRNKMKCCK